MNAMTILDTIAEYARQRVAADKASIPPEAMADMAAEPARPRRSL